MEIVTYAYAFDHSHDLPHAEVTSLVGGKAANLGVMTNELGLPVPPGFVISTEACRQYLANGWPYGLDAEIERHVKQLEKAVGRGFGEGASPLLVSVRSGAPISMPGMMDTILNLGLNPDTARGLAALTDNQAFVDGCWKRFVNQYQDIVGEAPAEDPWRQLRGAIEAVFRSWNSPRARSYREREGIPNGLGTGVIVQTMVFGNMGDDSATGVLFTRNPATGENQVYGDLMFNAQGEDVVAGTHDTEPISVLDDRLPDVAKELRTYAQRLEHHYADVCDIEFTIERGKLWMLQTRIGKRSPQAALRIAIEMAEDGEFPVDRAEAVRRVARYLVDPPFTPTQLDEAATPVCVGLGASPGVASGQIATTPDKAAAMAEAGDRVVLVRQETSPDDVHGMARSAGILTATGGLASHAAVVARGWGVPAVVGATDVSIDGDSVRIGEHVFGPGDMLTVDGSTGEVYAGVVASGSQIVPEAAVLLSWAEDLGIEIAGDDESAEDTTDDAVRQATREEVLHILNIKGFVTPNDLAPLLFTTPEAVAGLLDGAVEDGLAEVIGGSALAGMFQLTDDGKAVGAERIAADRDNWGADNAAKALDELLPYDQRMKNIMTGWQMREVDGRPALNDHSDEAHDAAVLADFEALHEDTTGWLAGLSEGLPRLSLYRDRLLRAAERVAAGETDYLASPRIDSFHNVWFELHEDLIRLAGRTREEEAAAGRA
jgi:pyruvate, orthophosphate dikinase